MQSRSILWRVIFYFTLASLSVSFVVAIAVILWSYQQQTQAYFQKRQSIELSYADSLASSLWVYDQNQLRSQLKGIQNLGGILYLRVSDDNNLNIEMGYRPHISQIQRIALYADDKQVGELELAFDNDLVISKATRMAINTFLAQLASLIFLALVLGYIVQKLINQRIIRLAHEVEDHRKHAIFKPLSVQSSNKNDEIDVLIREFNALSEQMNDELKQKTLAQQQLRVINSELEDRVQERTKNLQKTVDELNQTLSQLHSTQRKLIESEKLSSLGGMVAGIAHEINTPLGLCITMQSFLRDNYQAIQQKFDRGEITKQDFHDFLIQLNEGLNILDKNLQRAAQLIKSFKQVSEDQTGDHIRKVNLLEYFHEILETLSPKLKKTAHQVQIHCPEDLWVQNYAGAISQIITNLIMNSLLHAFSDNDKGTISLDAHEEKGKVYLRFRDNGIGLSAEAKHKIFEPFYTTKRGQGGTGLGMHLVYNIVSQRLQGEIQVEDLPHGTGFMICFPQISPDAEPVGHAAPFTG